MFTGKSIKKRTDFKFNFFLPSVLYTYSQTYIHIYLYVYDVCRGVLHINILTGVHVHIWFQN